MDLDILKRDEILSLELRNLYENYGYKKFSMCKFEEYSLYLENKNFLTTDKIITFNDLDGKLLALKPDVTLSIAKNAKDLNGEFEKLYYIENVYRLDKATKKYKEINQIGLEAIGKIDSYTTAEVLWLALNSLNRIDNNFILDVTSNAFVMGIFDTIDVAESAKSKILTCIVSKNLHDLALICQKCGLNNDFYEKISKLITINGDFAKSIENAEKLVLNKKMKNALKELVNVYNIFKNTEFASKIKLDFSIINDTNYYNGIIFQGYTARVPKPVLSGGRYDKLLEKMGKNLNAIGFALYFDEISKYYTESKKTDVDILIIYDDKTDEKLLIEKISEFNEQGYTVRAEQVFPNEIKFNKLFQLKCGKLTEVQNV